MRVGAVFCLSVVLGCTEGSRPQSGCKVDADCAPEHRCAPETGVCIGFRQPLGDPLPALDAGLDGAFDASRPDAALDAASREGGSGDAAADAAPLDRRVDSLR